MLQNFNNSRNTGVIWLRKHKKIPIRRSKNKCSKTRFAAVKLQNTKQRVILKATKKQALITNNTERQYLQSNEQNNCQLKILLPHNVIQVLGWNTVKKKKKTKRLLSFVYVYQRSTFIRRNLKPEGRRVVQ